MTEIELVNACCYKLIKECVETGADTMTITQENVTHLDKPLGNWEIIVRKKSYS